MKKLVFPFLILFACASLSANTAQDTITKAFQVVEIMPQFPGGEKAMCDFIAEKFYYPEEARRAGIEGRVTTRFVVNEDGSISQAQVLRGIHPQCDSVALSIINQMPKWTSGTQNGKPVKVYFTLPIVFRLPEDPNIVDGRVIYKRPEQSAKFAKGVKELKKQLKIKIKKGKLKYKLPYYKKVDAQFIVNKKGKMEDLIITWDGVGEDGQKAAIKRIKSLSKWIPAKHNGKNVDSYVRLSVMFEEK